MNTDAFACEDGGRDTRTSPAPDVLPICGLPLLMQAGPQGPVLSTDAGASWALEHLGARVLFFPLWPLPVHAQSYQSLWPLVQSLDGLLLPAYTEDAAVTQEVLAWERALAQLATALGIPMLASGEGALCWNAALGGHSRERPQAAEQPVSTPVSWEIQRTHVRMHSQLAALLEHAVTTRPERRLPASWELASRPQWIIEQLSPDLLPCAQSDAGTLLAFERADAAFGLGLLGRLDGSRDQPYPRVLFEAFLQACRAFARRRRRVDAGEAAREQICATVSRLVTQRQSLLVAPSALLPSVPPTPQAVERSRPVPDPRLDAATDARDKQGAQDPSEGSSPRASVARPVEVPA